MPSPDVVGAITHFNDTERLPELIQAMGRCGYSHIYLLDDASTNQDEILDVTAGYSSNDLTVVLGSVNRGPGANRNRILAQDIGDSVLVHFVDADIQFKDPSPTVTATIRDILDDPSIGTAGGLVYESSGLQLAFNYGPAYTVAAYAGGIIQERLYNALRSDDLAKASHIQEKYAAILQGYPNPLMEPQAKDVYWVIENNLMMRLDDLRRVGGFPEWRFHEIQAVAHELEDLGLRRRFDPRVAVEHTDAMPPFRRLYDHADAALRMIGTYGVSRFVNRPAKS